MNDSDRADLEAKILRASQGPEVPDVTYQRAAWKHLYRWILFIFVAGLDIAMPMSLLERISHHMVIKPMPELAQFGFLFFVNCYFLPVCLFEVNYVIVRAEELVVANLLWAARLKKGQIVSLTTPRLLVGGLLRTARCFYLINRADIPNSDELLTVISERFL
jgi:hypothetical protein